MLSFLLFSKDIGHPPDIMELERHHLFLFHYVGRFDRGTDALVVSSSTADGIVLHRLTDLNKLNAVKNARKRRLLRHFKPDLVKVNLGATFWVHLGESLKEDDSTQTLKTMPVSSLQHHIDLLTSLIEAL